MGYYRAGDYYRGDALSDMLADANVGQLLEGAALAPMAASATSATVPGMANLGTGLAIGAGQGLGQSLAHGLHLNLFGKKRHRRMNPLNPRALRRSMRRVQSFARFAKKTIQFTHHVKMKKHRRK